jgi:hypothetical protein
MREVITPNKLTSDDESSFDDWFDAAGVSDDFMNERFQEADQHRDSLGHLSELNTSSS